MPRVFIIHGWEGKPDSNWFPWLKAELEKKGYEAVTPAMPNSYEPQCGEWVDTLNKLMGTPTESDFLVGHSLAVIAIFRYLEQLKPGQKIGGAVLVSGFHQDLGIKQHHGFFDKPVDWESIRSHCKGFVVIHSDNDPYIPLAQAEQMAEKLDAKLIVEHDMGHISSGHGVTQLPDALDAVIGLSK